VSLDGGKTWNSAAHRARPWPLCLAPVRAAGRLPAGSHTLASRATDTAGNVQPEQRMENVGGYNNTSWADHAVKVTVA
jgi:sulfite oxidase